MQDAILKWNTSPTESLDIDKELTHIVQPSFSLSIQEFIVKHNTIVGITGEDDVALHSFAMALVDHKLLEAGSFQQSVGVSYYPEIPFMLEDCSIRGNVTFETDGNSSFNKLCYNEALSVVEVQFNPEADSILLKKDTMDKQFLQRVSLARAILEKRFVESNIFPFHQLKFFF